MSAAPAWPESRLWRFSLAVYSRPGVAEACLALQERHGVDVNLLLFCCWAGVQGRRIRTAEMRRAVAAVAGWHGMVVLPLRSLRQALKRDHAGAPAALAEMLRRRVAEAELDAERVEQLVLEPLLGVGGAGSRAAAAGNLETYMRLAGAGIGEMERAALDLLVAGTFAAS